MKTKTKTRNALCGLLSGLLLLAAGTAHATDLLRDNFENGNPATNPNGVGTGFAITNFSFGSGTLTEGPLGLTASGPATIKLAQSNDAIDPTGTTMTWVISSLPSGFGNGAYVGWVVNGGLAFGNNPIGGIALEVRPDRIVFDVHTSFSFQPAARHISINAGSTQVGAVYPGVFVSPITVSIYVSATAWKVDVTDAAGTVSVHKAGTYNPGHGLLDVLALSPEAGKLRAFAAAFRENQTTSFRSVLVVRDDAPTANAGADFSVNEGQTGVLLNGSLSSDTENDPLTYAWVQLPGGPAVALTGANTASPTFTAPTVALGGETLTFKLTVTANGESSEDTVSVTVVNINHPPVAEAGPDQSIAEGSPVTLDGSASFDIDTDPFTHAWVQVGGTPTVTLTGANTANPTFTAPYVGANGAPGVVATLVFELRVSDGFAPAATDAPAPGYALTNVVDRVTVEITNTNNDPIAAAGADQTVNENSAVALSAATSSDPDSDTLTYAWTKISGPTVTLTGAATATPSFTAPFVSAGGAELEFEVTVDDGYGGSDTDRVVIRVQNINDPPLASAAQPTVGVLWPPNHQMVAVAITGVSDPNNNATITITGVTQDEPTNGLGDGDTAIDAVINADGTVLLRAERSGKGDGRVYRAPKVRQQASPGQRPWEKRPLMRKP